MWAYGLATECLQCPNQGYQFVGLLGIEGDIQWIDHSPEMIRVAGRAVSNRWLCTGVSEINPVARLEVAEPIVVAYVSMDVSMIIPLLAIITGHSRAADRAVHSGHCFGLTTVMICLPSKEYGV